MTRLLLVLLGAAAIAAQVALDAAVTRYAPSRDVLWMRSPEAMQRLALGFDALAADVYWIRAVQYYGGTKLSRAPDKNYDLLYPLLDMTTTLDPRFMIAYRFGAILLSEGYPDGAGRPDQAIALLEKGIRQTPDRWQYYVDAGFVEYWWRQDYTRAADWFLRASTRADAPTWLAPLAASVLAEGGERGPARVLWTQLAQTAEQEWMRRTAQRRLLQLDAEEQVEQLQAIVTRFRAEGGGIAAGWADLVRAGRVRGVPLDPTGVPYVLDTARGVVDVAQSSELFPLRPPRPHTGRPS